MRSEILYGVINNNKHDVVYNDDKNQLPDVKCLGQLRRSRRNYSKIEISSYSENTVLSYIK